MIGSDMCIQILRFAYRSCIQILHTTFTFSKLGKKKSYVKCITGMILVIHLHRDNTCDPLDVSVWKYSDLPTGLIWIPSIARSCSGLYFPNVERLHFVFSSSSRLVIWLELAPTNRQPEQTCSYFIEAVRDYAVPHNLRVDAATENDSITLAQASLCADFDRLSGLPTSLEGSSNHNEVIIMNRLNYLPLLHSLFLFSFWL